MGKKYLIVFYTVEPKPPEVFWDNEKEMQMLFERIVELTKHKAKFAIYSVGTCVGDFS